MTTQGSKYRGSKEYLQVYAELILTARSQGLVRYVRVAELIGIHTPGHHMAKEVGQVLGEVSEDEVRAGRPMLSAVAVAEDGRPGNGFYNLAQELDLLSRDAAADREEFWQEQRRRVYDTWRAP